MIDQLSPTLQRLELDLIQQMNGEAIDRNGPSPPVDGAIESFELAFRMQDAVPKLMDLSKKTLDLYGSEVFAIQENFDKYCMPKLLEQHAKTFGIGCAVQHRERISPELGDTGETPRVSPIHPSQWRRASLQREY